MRPSSANDGSCGITGRGPFASTPMRGKMRSMRCSARVWARHSAAVAKRTMPASVWRVGFGSFMSGSFNASAGRTQRSSSVSSVSADGVCPGGASATKKRVSKRLGRPFGVSQWLW